MNIEDINVHQRLVCLLKGDVVKEEKKLTFVDVLQEKDLRYLVDTIWGGKSAISGAQGVGKLTVCRWDRASELTPWNVLLVTEMEKKSHAEFQKGGMQYTDDFLRMIQGRHGLAKAYFSKLVAYAEIGV